MNSRWRNRRRDVPRRLAGDRGKCHRLRPAPGRSACARRDPQRLLDAFERVDQARDIQPPAGVRQLERVAARQVLDRLGKVARGRHLGVLHEDRDDAGRTGERVLDLDAQVVVGIVETPNALALEAEPARADDDQHDIAALQRLVDDVGKVLTGTDRIEVDEDVVVPELIGEGVVETARLPRRVLAAIADEDLQRLVRIARGARQDIRGNDRGVGVRIGWRPGAGHGHGFTGRGVTGWRRTLCCASALARRHSLLVPHRAQIVRSGRGRCATVQRAYGAGHRSRPRCAKRNRQIRIATMARACPFERRFQVDPWPLAATRNRVQHDQ